MSTIHISSYDYSFSIYSIQQSIRKHYANRVSPLANTYFYFIYIHTYTMCARLELETHISTCNENTKWMVREESYNCGVALFVQTILCRSVGRWRRAWDVQNDTHVSHGQNKSPNTPSWPISNPPIRIYVVFGHVIHIFMASMILWLKIYIPNKKKVHTVWQKLRGFECVIESPSVDVNFCLSLFIRVYTHTH